MARRQVTFLLLFLCAALLCSVESRAQEAIDPRVARLIEDLSNPDPDERRSSASALGNMAAGSKLDLEKAKKAVPALARAMKDKDNYVRESAAFALGNIRADPGTSVPPLMEGLKDKESSVRKRSAEARGGFGRDAQSAVPALVEALRDQDDDVQRQAAEAIGEIGGNAWILVPALLNAFKNSNNSQAADVLADIGRKAADVHADIWRDASSAVPTLVEILQERDGTRSAKAAEVLGAIGPEAGAAVPALVDALKDRDRYIAARAAGALGRIGENQKEAVAVAARVVAEDLGEEPWWNRAAAAEALGELGVYAAVRFLLCQRSWLTAIRLAPAPGLLMPSCGSQPRFATATEPAPFLC